jgi:hypothetical protein
MPMPTPASAITAKPAPIIFADSSSMTEVLPYGVKPN